MGTSSLRRPARRVAFVVGDQAISGLTNVVVAVATARSVTDQSFGAFSIGFIVYTLALGLVRGLVGQPLAVRHGSQGDREAPPPVATALGAAVVVGAATGVVVAATGSVVGANVGAVLVAFGMGLPALLLQDSLRFAFFTLGMPVRAVVADTAWLVTLIPLLVLANGLDDSGAVVPRVAAWGVAGTASAIVGLSLARARPELRGAGPFLRAHRDLGLRFAGEFLVHTGATQATMLLLGSVIGTAGIGAMRGGQMLFGPYYTLLTGLTTAALAEGARLVVERPDRLVRAMRCLSGGLTVLGLAWGMGLTVLPQSWGERLLGDSWSAASGLIVPLSVAIAGYAVASGADVGLRVLEAARQTFRIRVVVALTVIASGILGGLSGGLTGAVWGLAIGPWMTAIAEWWCVDRRSTLVVSTAPARHRGH